MALINCPECHHSVSDCAYQCPQCGFPLHPRPSGICQIPKFDTMNQPNSSYKKMPTALIAFIGVICYLVISVLADSLFKCHEEYILGLWSHNFIIRVEILICTYVCIFLIAIIIDFTENAVDVSLFSILLILTSCICCHNWKVLGYGTVFIIFVTQIGMIILASYLRTHPTSISITIKKSNLKVAIITCSFVFATFFLPYICGAVYFD